MSEMAALTVKGVCLDPTGRVLLCRNDRAQWELPGGRPEEGESFEACLVREIAEETGLVVDVRGLIAAYPLEVLPGRWVNVIVYGCELRHAATPTVSAEHENVVFADLAEVDPRELPDGYRQAIHSWRKDQSRASVRRNPRVRGRRPRRVKAEVREVGLPGRETSGARAGECAGADTW